MALADNPDFRFVVSNTTEAGIAFDETCKFDEKPCTSFPGKLTQLLYKRYENKMKGFIFLPTQLIDNNGAALKKCVLQYADLWNLGEDFKAWVNSENSFINTLVDRIVTGYPSDETVSLHPEDKYLDTAELFHLWVIEGDCEDELPLKKAGFNVIWTDDAKPYKKIKVRILNGAHTSLVAASLLSDVETVGETMKDGLLSSYLGAVMRTEILPVIGENEDSRKFADSVFDRFRNPFIQHKWRSIALNSVSKFSVRVLPTILEYKEKTGEYPALLTLSLAYLIYFYKNDMPEDNSEVIYKMKNGALEDILADTSLWQADLSEMTDKVRYYCNQIAKLGAKETMKWILSE
jgi:tagaturonate reductase